MNRLETRIDRLEAASGVGIKSIDEIILIGVEPGGNESVRAAWHREAGSPHFILEASDDARG